ncbi:MAG: restriction endonuclease subunit S [Bacteroidetes bacterium]|nr:restriction endonuclease subunit S [Bacteroidota bacterium]
MKKTVSEICHAFFGANAAAKYMGDYRCVQGRDFDADGNYINTEPLFFDRAEITYTNLLKPGHVLFSSKGRIFATVWQGQIKEAVATGTFIVLEPRSKEIIPEYLALYLNSSKAKRYFDLHLKTATVNHIGKKQLDQLEIEIPSIQKQQLLVKAYQLIVEKIWLLN